VTAGSTQAVAPEVAAEDAADGAARRPRQAIGRRALLAAAVGAGSGGIALGAVLTSTDWLAAFGARPAGARLARLARSPQWRDGAFRNPVPTRLTAPGGAWRMLRRQLLGRERRVPPGPVPVARPGRAAFGAPPASGLRATWLGHATALLEVDGARVLVDPVWAERASPSGLAGPRRFHPPPLALADLPPLDAVAVSHDHYDHLDMRAVRALAADPRHAGLRFVVPLGVGAHLARWGVAPARVAELDWGEATQVGPPARPLTLTATPARHFSGRGLGDALGAGNPTLWASWVIAGPRYRVFVSGDTGPWAGFAGVGARHGPFDLTLIKVGAYDPAWPDIHLTPEQAVAVHRQVRGRVLLPVHWGTFNLAFHAWDEPAERVLAAARAAGVPLALPRPGQPVEPASLPPLDPWWRAVTTGRARTTGGR
jgi:L-ascorbate metabolism protein UlaG (beta-lactamase superfamily)